MRRIGLFPLSLILASQLFLPASSQTAQSSPSAGKPVEDKQGADKQSAADKAAVQSLVVLIYDDSCKTSCTIVRPIMKEICTEYCQKVRYVELNTSKESLKESCKTAKEINVHSFLADSSELVPIVGVFCARGGKVIKEIRGAKTRDVYKTAIEKALEKVH
jgi:predicted DsbA family dithiol-disulfide isomerase